MWIATADHCREIDRRSSEEYGVPGRLLMERAGLAVFAAVKHLLPEGGRISVFCGKGNNGGDGFVVARLAQEAGYGVDCLVASEEENLAHDAREQMLGCRALGVKPIFADDARYARRIECIGCRDLIVDALLGTGAQSEVRGHVKDAIQVINRSGVPVISVDVPSGIRCDTGEELGESVWALKTITFGLPKPFLFQSTGLEHSGYWAVADIGYPPPLLQEPTEARLIDGQWVADLLPERLRASHKGENGHVIVVAGSEGMPGAALMAARAAIRAGAGLVTVASVPSVCQTVAAQLPECLQLRLPEKDGLIAPEAAEILLEKQSKYHAALFGPGLTHEAPILEFLAETWKGWQKPSVIDADALNSVAQGVALPNAECVLTPHPGEMSRLLEESIAEIQCDRFQTVRTAIQKFKRCVLLKGPFSIVGEEKRPMAVNCTGNPGLASGGMGDVLGGVMTTLLGQGLPPYYAASCAMYWHGLAGDICAEKIGPIGYMASEVANALPQARAKIVSSCDTDTFCSS
ncbi:MAG: hypothetical protein BGO01_09685 [Armatimonadetes bacterium 55-13]|nr:NAD(P)H-hydrate dehydratase [Armatimonadota bacterium]OJU62676.1 MAG: hypothetical protein BGO01_09685 [Armatimonadetes bacterium 55-13]